MLAAQQTRISSLQAELVVMEFSHRAEIDRFRKAHNGIVDALINNIDQMSENAWHLGVYRLGSCGNA